jgi:beta-lactamase superfamily II metal-dependent hydrolase
MPETKPLKVGYATYPSVKLFSYQMVLNKSTNKKEKKFKFLKELLFGDYLKPLLTSDDTYDKITEDGKEYIKVHARNADGYILPNEIQKERILEVNFIDIGQGDGCHIVTPKDKHFILDAGAGDNMFRFLQWRFNLKTAKTPPPAFTGIISHSDNDHYGGFSNLFTEAPQNAQQISFETIFHNGMVEQSGAKPDSLGTVVSKGNKKYISDLTDTDVAFKKIAADTTKKGEYISVLKKTKAKILSLGRKDISIPIFVPKTDDIQLEVLGPFRENIDGKDGLPIFDSNKGKTKNGHSVILKLVYKNLKVLLGGDLNSESEDYLLSKYGEADIAAIKKELKKTTLTESKRKQLDSELDAAIMKTRKYFEVDVAKSCHHGSSDFTSEFLKCLNPMATVISSGDDEPHCHPRPDTLGTIGKFSRGERSLIFSTELARSGKEFIDLTKIAGPKKKIRAVTVYGMINLRSDGNKMIIAQKLERPASGRGWDKHLFEYSDTTKQFEYKRKGE